MTVAKTPWTARVHVELGRSEVARWLERALAPEASREVPRARTEIYRSGSALELAVSASDAGAMRAALNTFLGWVALALATLDAARGAPPPAAPAAEAVISRSR
ncbi:MAG TPA: KEOPS complex subunit Pcc1 [Thermoplasmata archaeon]|nr:KEOPS complex subunit Pcc1 [Thermoplasmata archaeon]